MLAHGPHHDCVAPRIGSGLDLINQILDQIRLRKEHFAFPCANFFFTRGIASHPFARPSSSLLPLYFFNVTSTPSDMPPLPPSEVACSPLNL